MLAWGEDNWSSFMEFLASTSDAFRVYTQIYDNMTRNTTKHVNVVSSLSYTYLGYLSHCSIYVFDISEA